MKQETTTIELERHIAAPPETVFEYFMDPTLYKLWQGVDAELDPRPGGAYRVTMTGRSGTTVRGTYLEVDPPSRLVFTWGWDPRDEGLAAEMADVPVGSSTVEITLDADGDGTILRIRHSDLPTEGTREFHHSGWKWTMERLQIAAEGGDVGSNPMTRF